MCVRVCPIDRPSASHLDAVWDIDFEIIIFLSFFCFRSDNFTFRFRNVVVAFLFIIFCFVISSFSQQHFFFSCSSVYSRFFLFFVHFVIVCKRWIHIVCIRIARAAKRSIHFGSILEFRFEFLYIADHLIFRHWICGRRIELCVIFFTFSMRFKRLEWKSNEMR